MTSEVKAAPPTASEVAVAVVETKKEAEEPKKEEKKESKRGAKKKKESKKDDKPRAKAKKNKIGVTSWWKANVNSRPELYWNGKPRDREMPRKAMAKLAHKAGALNVAKDARNAVREAVQDLMFVPARHAEQLLASKGATVSKEADWKEAFHVAVVNSGRHRLASPLPELKPKKKKKAVAAVAAVAETSAAAAPVPMDVGKEDKAAVESKKENVPAAPAVSAIKSTETPTKPASKSGTKRKAGKDGEKEPPKKKPKK
jgi:hypothetical protein